MAVHASHASLPYPVKNARFTFQCPVLRSATDGTLIAPSTPDSEFSLDNGNFADCAEELTSAGTNRGSGIITLTGAETNGSVVGYYLGSTGALPTSLELYPRELPILSTGTLAAGSAGGGTLQASGLPGYSLVGAIIRTTGGTGGGGTGGANNQARVIATHTVSSGAFTVIPNWETTPSTDTTYDILQTDLLVVAAKANATAWNGTAIADDIYDLLGIVAIGTAQSVDATHIQLAAATAITDDVIIGATVHVYSSTNGFHERRIITDWVSSTDTALVDAWTQTPTGTIKYIVYATAPGSVSSPIPADLRWMLGGAQSATDLKDFADTGYDPATHKATALLGNVQGIKKNTAFADFTFPMYDGTDPTTLKTGLTVTATRSLAGAAFGSCANAVAEIGTTGVYVIDLAAADLNADAVGLRFTAAGAVPNIIFLAPVQA
jgi:hypothetical protein